VFASASHSARGRGVDRIEDFERGRDVIDLARIDADATRSGDQRAVFIGTDSFDGVAGELRYVSGWSSRVAQLDRDGDARADFELVLDGAGGLGASDFLL
jgi:serralysin